LAAGLYFLLSNISLLLWASGMAQIANLLFNVGYQLSNETTYPGWKTDQSLRLSRKNL
jgi:hypothetical protein